MRRHLLAIAVILTVAPGCDNVGWGGVDVKWVPPPAGPAGSDSGAAAAEEAAPPEPHGPLLLAGLRSESRATLVVVGEVHGEVLAYPSQDTTAEARQRLAEQIAPGTEWVLFSEGVRVGRMTVDADGRAPEYCSPRPTVSGVVELVPPASSADRLIALPAAVAGDREYDRFLHETDSYDQRVATLTLAGDVIPRVQARYPPDGLVAARKDLEIFRTRRAAGPTIAATFMYRDSLTVAPPGQGAYALFIMGDQTGDQYRESFVWYRAVDTEGKGAPRYFGALDWDGDGDQEILLDVYGANRRWFAGLAQQGGRWVRTFQDTCGSSATAGG
jgi:hypothetical protein